MGKTRGNRTAVDRLPNFEFKRTFDEEAELVIVGITNSRRPLSGILSIYLKVLPELRMTVSTMHLELIGKARQKRKAQEDTSHSIERLQEQKGVVDASIEELKERLRTLENKQHQLEMELDRKRRSWNAGQKEQSRIKGDTACASELLDWLDNLIAFMRVMEMPKSPEKDRMLMEYYRSLFGNKEGDVARSLNPQGFKRMLQKDYLEKHIGTWRGQLYTEQ